MVSYKLNPGKWVWGLIPLALPFLGAHFLNAPVMVSNLTRSAQESLKLGGLEEVRVALRGRDAILTGQAQSREAIDKAVRTVAGVYGIRHVKFSDIKLVRPVILELPTVIPGAGRTAQPKIKGTWPEGVAKTLSVKVGDKTYVLGQNKELVSDGNGNWSLKPSKNLVDGNHDVIVSITDGKKAAALDSSKNELVIDTTPPPAAKTTTKLTTKQTRPTVSGTWANKESNSLAIRLAGKEYVLGKDKSLTVDDNGNWTLTPPTDLNDGTYDVIVKTADKLGNVSTSNAKGALTVDTTAPTAGSVVVSQGANVTPVIKGIWSIAAGNTLVVEVGGKKYSLGKHKELKADNKGNWTLTLANPLSPGKHAVTVITADALGNEKSVTSPNAIDIDVTPPASPEVTSAINATTKPVFKGTWAEKAGNTLKVFIAGKVFALGRNKQLTSDGNGNWTLSLSEPLGDGKYPILVESADAFGNLARSKKPAVVAVDTTKPDKPTINSLSTRSKTPTITGTWPQSDQNSLIVSLNSKNYAFGNNTELTSDGKGNWSLAPSGELVDGKYAVIATVTDQAGNKSVAKNTNALTIDRIGPAAATITSVDTKSSTVAIIGTWDHIDSARISVSVAGKIYSSDKTSEITQNGKNWSLNLTGPMKDGEYDATISVSDKLGNKTNTTVSKAIVIDTTPPQLPTVTTVLTRERKPTITGTWDSSDAVDLVVSVANQSFSNANQGEIKINGDHWSVVPRTPIADGTYNVVAVVADKLGNSSKDAGTGELVIDGTSPATPTVRPVFGTNQRPPVSGTWPEDSQNSLSVGLAGKTYALSKGSPLTSDGKGNWKLTLVNDLPAGSYDVKVKVADRLGNQSNDVSNGEIWIKAKQKPVPPKTVVTTTAPSKPDPAVTPRGKAVNTCQKEFTVVLAGQNISFKTSKVEIAPASRDLIERLAKIAKACLDAKIIVSGHTDSRGSASFNKSLSEGRASAVVDALVTLGVAKSRLRAVGYGESRPIAGNDTKQGMAKNRRIEFRVEQ